MAHKKVTVVISQSQGNNPARRHLEEELAAALMMDADVDVSLVPHLYDMSHDHTGMMFLRSIPGDLIILGWLYPRAMQWILDRQGIKGHSGITLLNSADEEQEDEPDVDGNGRGIGPANVPDRKIYCVDFRHSPEPRDYLDEIRRIASETAVQTVDLMQWIQGAPKADQLERYLHPEQLVAPPNGSSRAISNDDEDGSHGLAGVEPVKRRWYPVIDYDRCTNCMECIDFCLFGVYGVDSLDRILVESQDNCKKGCPACSRVCPEHAIIFPGHKSPEIAGAAGEIGNFKIDLSKLFGGTSGLEIAVKERDVELVRDGREAVGISVGLPKRRQGAAPQPRDDLDDLMDNLDTLNL